MRRAARPSLSMPATQLRLTKRIQGRLCSLLRLLQAPSLHTLGCTLEVSRSACVAAADLYARTALQGALQLSTFLCASHADMHLSHSVRKRSRALAQGPHLCSCICAVCRSACTWSRDTCARAVTEP